jgi:ABC-type transporter Mla maintaining outer membrane lipid asymmetry ATPase subunit MlaF
LHCDTQPSWRAGSRDPIQKVGMPALASTCAADHLGDFSPMRMGMLERRRTIGMKVAGLAPAGVPVGLLGLTRRFGPVTAINDVSIDIAAGEFLALLGPSGSGKTSILMAIAGFLELDAGLISIGGRDVTRLAPYERNIGMVFQRYALFPHMTVAQNIAFPLRQRGIAAAQIRRDLQWILELVGLAGLEGRFAAELSGG